MNFLSGKSGGKSEALWAEVRVWTEGNPRQTAHVLTPIGRWEVTFHPRPPRQMTEREIQDIATSAVNQWPGRGES